jgi:hypothetical protein
MPHYAMPVMSARRSFRIGGVDRSDPEQAFDAADNAANRSADDRSDRPRCIHADGTAMGDALGNALRLRRERHGERCGYSGAKQDVNPHATTLSFC